MTAILSRPHAPADLETELADRVCEFVGSALLVIDALTTGNLDEVLQFTDDALAHAWSLGNTVHPLVQLGVSPDLERLAPQLASRLRSLVYMTDLKTAQGPGHGLHGAQQW